MGTQDQQQLDPPTITVGFSYAYINKQVTPAYIGASGNRTHYPAHTVTLDQFTQHVLSGYAFTPAVLLEGYRDGKHFVSSQMIVLDLDDAPSNPGTAELAAHPYIAQYAALIYRTPSYTDENPRHRVIFILDEPIRDTETYERIVQGIVDKLPFVIDKMSRVSVQPYYGSTKGGAKRFPHNRLPLAVAHQTIAAKKIPTAPRESRPVTINQGDDEYVTTKCLELYDAKIAELATTTSNRWKAIYDTAWLLFSRALGGWVGHEDSRIETDLYRACQDNGFIQDRDHGEREFLTHVRNARSDAIAVPFEDRRKTPVASAAPMAAVERVEQVQASPEPDDLPYMPPLDYEAMGANMPADDSGQPDEPISIIYNTEPVAPMLKIVTKPTAAAADVRYFVAGFPKERVFIAEQAGLNSACYRAILETCRLNNRNVFSVPDVLDHADQIAPGLKNSTLRDLVKWGEGKLWQKVGKVRILPTVDEEDSVGKFRTNATCYELYPVPQQNEAILTAYRERLRESLMSDDEESATCLPAPINSGDFDLADVDPRFADVDSSLVDASNQASHRLYIDHADALDKTEHRIEREIAAARQRLQSCVVIPLDTSWELGQSDMLIAAILQNQYRGGVQKSRAALSAEIGKSKRSVYKYMRLAGFEAHQPKIDPVPVKEIGQAYQVAKQHSAMIVGFHVTTPEGKRTEHDRMGYEGEKSFVLDQTAKGNTVCAKFISPNVYKLTRPGAPVIEVKEPAVEVDEVEEIELIEPIEAPEPKRQKPAFDPFRPSADWVYGQLVLRLKMLYPQRFKVTETPNGDTWWIDHHTGDEFSNPTARQLIDILLNPANSVLWFAQRSLGATVTESDLPRKARTS